MQPAFSLRVRSKLSVIDRLEPEMTKAKRKELIKQFRDAVYEHQQRGLRRR